MSPPVASKITCFDSARAVSRAVRSSAVKRLPAETSRSRSAASRNWRSSRSICSMAEPRSRSTPPMLSAQLLRDREQVDRIAAVDRPRSAAPCGASCASSRSARWPACSTPSAARRKPFKQRMRLRHAVEHRIHLGDVGADAFAARPRWRRPCRRAGVCAAVGRHQRDELAADLVEMRQNRVDLLARDAVRAIAERRQRVLDRVRPIGDLRLLDDAGGALERVGEAQQALHRAGAAAALLELEHALRELIEQLARLEPKVSVRVLRHADAPSTPPCAAG